MSQPQSNEKQKEKLLLHNKIDFEIVEKQVYDEEWNEWDNVIEITINNDKYTKRDVDDFDDILESLEQKIEVLKYISDETYDAIAKDILLDIALLLYKLSSHDVD